MKEFLGTIGWAIIIVGSFYWIPWFIRKGWNDAENRTKKVCDKCFRDIKKWNEVIKRADEQREIN